MFSEVDLQAPNTAPKGGLILGVVQGGYVLSMRYDSQLEAWYQVPYGAEKRYYNIVGWVRHPLLLGLISDAEYS